MKATLLLTAFKRGYSQLENDMLLELGASRLRSSLIEEHRLSLSFHLSNIQKPPAGDEPPVLVDHSSSTAENTKRSVRSCQVFATAVPSDINSSHMPSREVWLEASSLLKQLLSSSSDPQRQLPAKQWSQLAMDLTVLSQRHLSAAHDGREQPQLLRAIITAMQVLLLLLAASCCCCTT